MAIDTPATIAVLGAGPLGLEATLYARYLGYQVDVYEEDDLAGAVRRGFGESLPGSFGENRSRLALAALAAQDASYRPPDDRGAVPAIEEMLDAYWRPLAESDLVADSLRFNTVVVSIESRDNDDEDDDDRRAGEEPGNRRPTTEWLITFRRSGGKKRTESADAVIDTTGQFADNGPDSPNYYAIGGTEEGPTPIGAGLDRIRQVFAVIGGREDLDLYQHIQF